MTIIRRSYHYGVIYLNPQIISGKALCGQTVSVLDVNGESKPQHFAGFCSLHDIQLNGCVIDNITGYTPENTLCGPWVDYHKQDWFLGHRSQSGINLVLTDGYPLRVNRFSPEKEYPTLDSSNVVTIRA